MCSPADAGGPDTGIADARVDAAVSPDTGIADAGVDAAASPDTGSDAASDGGLDGGSSGRYRAAVLAAGPIAYWPLDEASGSVAADIIGHRDGTVIGTVTRGSPALVSGGLSSTFGGSGYIEVPYASALNTPQFTVEFWARVDGGAGTTRSPFTNREGNDTLPLHGYSVFADNANLWEVYSGGTRPWTTTFNATGTSAIGATHHVAVTYDGATVRLYVDGVMSAMSTLTTYVVNSSLPLRIGTCTGNATESIFQFIGGIDEVALFDRALPAATIATHFAAR